MSKSTSWKLPADVAEQFQVVGDVGPVVHWNGTVDLRTISVDNAAALVKQKFPHLKEKPAKPAKADKPEKPEEEKK